MSQYGGEVDGVPSDEFPTPDSSPEVAAISHSENLFPRGPSAYLFAEYE